MNDNLQPLDGAETHDLSMENQRLENEIRLLGGHISKNGAPDDELYNQFLHNILTFEAEQKGPRQLIGSLFPDDVSFPPSDNLNETQISEKLAYIEDFLGRHEIFLKFHKSVPGKMVYDYLTKEVFLTDEVPLERISGMALHLDGCDGYCPFCFQKDYCSIK